VEAFASVAETRSTTYVSSPLTTGPRAFEWHRQRDGHSPTTAFAEGVIEPNRREAAAFVRDLRSRVSEVVIDPTAMSDIPEWEQDDYRYFWGRVIETYCARVIFRGGWQYSSGCSYEFVVAAARGISTLTEDLEPLEASDAATLLGDAIEEILAHGASPAFLSGARDALLTGEVG
jgi:hypothetical protein